MKSKEKEREEKRANDLIQQEKDQVEKKAMIETAKNKLIEEKKK